MSSTSGDEDELARDRRLVAARWLAVAREDLRVAGLCLDADEPSRSAAACHCQQAAEKLIKDLLVLAAVPFTKTHDLERLGTLAAPCYPREAELFEANYFFTSWAFDFRYRGIGADLPDEPDDAELRDAIKIIGNLVDCLRGHLSLSE